MGTMGFLSDNLLELRGPVDIATNAAFGSGSGIAGKLYDTALDTRVGTYTTVTTADAIEGATSIFVQDRTPLVVSDGLAISLDDGTEQAVGITVLPGSEGEVTFIFALDAPVAKGATVKRTSLFNAAGLFITLENWDGWENGMTLEITADDHTQIDRTINLIDRDSGYATLSSVVLDPTSPGNEVKRKIGAIITMSSFGVFPTSDPVIGDPAWGFRGTISYLHAEIELGMRIRAEIRIVDATSGTNFAKKAVSTVINI